MSYITERFKTGSLLEKERQGEKRWRIIKS